MEEYSLSDVAYENIQQGYRNQWELMRDLFALLDYRLYLFYKYHQWIGPGNDMKNMLGLVVSREEFEHNLKKSEQLGLCRHISEDERVQMELGESAIRSRLKVTSARIALVELFERFALDAFARNCVVLAYAAVLDKKYERLFAYLQDDILKKEPGKALAVQLYLPTGRMIEEYISIFEQNSEFTSLFSPEELHAGMLRLRPVVLSFLSGSICVSHAMELFEGAAEELDPIIIRHELARALENIVTNSPRSAVSITGLPGSGRRFLLRHLAAQKGERCLFVDASSASAIEEAALTARLTNAYLCLYGLETQDEEDGLVAPATALMHKITDIRLEKALFLVCQKALHLDIGRTMMELTVAPTEPVERFALLEHYLQGIPLKDVSLQEVAAKFRFGPLQIKQACAQAREISAIHGGVLDAKTLHECCYCQAVHRLDKLATRVMPRFQWDDVVLPAQQKRLMQHAVEHIRHAHTVYHTWGFDQKVTYGRGLSILFAGAPGTGKTMCAQVIAKQLNMEMYKINISQVISKYIGETEKNLQAVFNEARKSNCILFFDECDAIFSKRSEVKDAHDRNANVEVAYLLQQIEEHDGVCVLATNLMQNIDSAFMRRITFVVHFPFPDPSMRREIYLRTLAPSAPVSADVDWDFLAEKFELSGGYIKNIVLSAAFMAAAQGEEIGMRHLLEAAVNELKKNEIVVVREDLREYADLLFAEDGK